MTHLTVLAIAGSLRTNSFNGLLIDAARALAPPETIIERYHGLRQVPLYDPDLDTATPPASVADLRARIAAADGLLIATPEYNQAVPGVLKNALDWASRQSALAGKPAAIMSASPSRFGGIRGQTNLRQILTACGTAVIAKPEVAVFSANEAFDAEGHLVDDAATGYLSALLDALAAKIHNTVLADACA